MPRIRKPGDPASIDPVALRKRPCKTKGKITFESVTFKWAAFDHEEGGGYSYNIQIDADDPKDVIHLDTKRGTVFNEEELIALREYWKAVKRSRG